MDGLLLKDVVAAAGDEPFKLDGTKLSCGNMPNELNDASGVAEADDVADGVWSKYVVLFCPTLPPPIALVVDDDDVDDCW